MQPNGLNQHCFFGEPNSVLCDILLSKELKKIQCIIKRLLNLVILDITKKKNLIQ